MNEWFENNNIKHSDKDDLSNSELAALDAKEVMEQLVNFGSEFADEKSEQMFKEWLTEKIERIMDEMDQ